MKFGKKTIRLFVFCTLHLSCLLNVLCAQDTLYKRDGSKLVAKVLFVNEFDVVLLPGDQRFSKYQFRILRNTLLYIRYENNWVDTFASEQEDFFPVLKKELRKQNYGRNRMSSVLSDLLAGVLTFHYERTLRHGKFSFGIPVSMSLSELGPESGNYNRDPRIIDYYSRAKILSSGLHFNYYPFGHGAVAYWVGANTEYGLSKNIYYYALLAQNGFIFHPHKNIHISVAAAFGGFQAKRNGVVSGGGSTGRGSFLLGFTF